MLGYGSQLGEQHSVKRVEHPLSIGAVQAAASADWVVSGAVTSVKDQSTCGSCWAFSSAGALEGAHFITNGELLNLSQQQLIDCVKGCYGCQGGWEYKAFEYYETYYAMSDEAYPYMAHTWDYCYYDYDKATFAATSSYQYGKENDPDALKNAVYQQPVSVGLNASTDSFQFYESGVMDDTSCPLEMNHAVLLVGYGHDSKSGLEYWIVKNSYG